MTARKLHLFIIHFYPAPNCVEKRAQKIPRIHWDARDCGNKKSPAVRRDTVVEEGGFEPPKRIATDLQSAPFGHSGTPPYSVSPTKSKPSQAGLIGQMELVDGLEPPTC